VIAPSRVARRPADRIKTDRRDALLLARLHCAGELAPVAIPEPQDEAIRDLVRAREDALNDQRRVRQRLKSFLLRHGHAYTGTRWGPKHELFLSKIKFEDSAQDVVFTEYRMAVRFATELVERVTQSLRAHAETWRWLPIVKGLMTLRSIDLISALTIVAELGDLRRFPHPREFMSYLGLVPSEHSSGNSKQRGRLTKTGNTHVRRILVEAAWNYRLPARIGESLQPRLEGQPQQIIDIARKAQLHSASVTDFAGCGHAVCTRTRHVRQSHANCAGSSGISASGSSQPEHLRSPVIQSLKSGGAIAELHLPSDR